MKGFDVVIAFMMTIDALKHKCGYYLHEFSFNLYFKESQARYCFHRGKSERDIQSSSRVAKEILTLKSSI